MIISLNSIIYYLPKWFNLLARCNFKSMYRFKFARSFSSILRGLWGANFNQDTHAGHRPPWFEGRHISSCHERSVFKPRKENLPNRRSWVQLPEHQVQL